MFKFFSLFHSTNHKKTHNLIFVIFKITDPYRNFSFYVPKPCNFYSSFIVNFLFYNPNMVLFLGLRTSSGVGGILYILLGRSLNHSFVSWIPFIKISWLFKIPKSIYEDKWMIHLNLVSLKKKSCLLKIPKSDYEEVWMIHLFRMSLVNEYPDYLKYVPTSIYQQVCITHLYSTFLTKENPRYFKCKHRFIEKYE